MISPESSLNTLPSVQASAQMAQVVYLPDFPASKAPAETVNTETATPATEKTA